MEKTIKDLVSNLKPIQPTVKCSNRMATAIHEAGHVYISMRKGIKFTRVTLNKDDDKAGKVEFDSNQDKYSDGFIYAHFAGLTAEQILLGKFCEDGFKRDAYNIMDFYTKKTPPPDVLFENWFTPYINEVSEILRENGVKEIILLIAENLCNSPNLELNSNQIENLVQ